VARGSKTLPPVVASQPVVEFPTALLDAVEDIDGVSVLEIGPHDRGLLALGHPEVDTVAAAFDRWARDRWGWASAAGETTDDGRVTREVLRQTHATVRTRCADSDLPSHGKQFCGACAWPLWAAQTNAEHTCDEVIGCWVCDRIAESPLWLSWIHADQQLPTVAAEAYFPITMLETAS